jgi:hypothetical protein
MWVCQKCIAGGAEEGAAPEGMENGGPEGGPVPYKQHMRVVAECKQLRVENAGLRQKLGLPADGKRPAVPAPPEVSTGCFGSRRVHPA